MNRFFILLCVLFLSICSRGQNKQTIDSLEMQVPLMTGEKRARALYDLVSYYLRVDAEKAKLYFNQSKVMAGEPQPSVAAYGFLAKGVYYNRNGKLDSAINQLETARELSITSGVPHALLMANSTLAHTYISSGKPQKGLEYLYEGLKLATDAGDREMEMKLRTNVSWAYLELKQYRNCIDYGLKNLSLMEGSDYEWIALYTYNNIAVSYGALGILDSARHFIQKGITAAQKSNDNQALANAYFILGKIYSDAGEYDLAIAQYLKARPFREKVGNPFFIVSDLYAMSELYNRLGQYGKGIAAGKEALDLAAKYNLTLKFEGAYLSLARNYEALNDHRNASKYYQLYSSAKDTIYRNASTQAIAEMQEKYESERKEKQLAVQKAAILQQRSEIRDTYIVISGLAAALILITGIFVFLRIQTKRRQAMLAKEQELNIREAQMQASIQSQENERKRFAQDLHDGMGQLISALRLALHGVQKESTLESRVEVVSRSEGILNEMHHEIRSIAFNLMPQTLVQHGLLAALKEMGDRLSGSEKVILRVTGLDVPVRLSEMEEISLYRVVQEWVNNVTKYANANLVHIQVIGHQGELTITIEDDGAGFDPEVLQKGNGNGWRNIQSRLNLVKGSIEIDSRAGFGGTTVIIRMPLAVKSSAEQSALESGHEFRPATVGPNTH